ncbi:probable vacuolar protein 8 at N-terminal half [Coccomyxa sp. Obi]|nr:probable vacuolar protein 8 at N-terminal half [Coccomyxa sp. Obi]
MYSTSTSEENARKGVQEAETNERARHHVAHLFSGPEEQRLRAALALRDMAGNPAQKGAVREAGGVEALLAVLDGGYRQPQTIVAAEALSCLAVDDMLSRDLMRQGNAAGKLVTLLAAGPDSEAAHRALLALRILTDREGDRSAILRSGGIPHLVALLRQGPDSEYTEYAAAVLGNLAAGGQPLKDAIREAGAIGVLVQLLAEDTGAIAAELAAVVLRNLALGNAANRAAIVSAGGLQPLLDLLSMGQDKLVHPMPCEMVYAEEKGPVQQRHKTGQCCFDPTAGHLCVVATSPPGVFGCIQPPRQASPRDSGAERYSLMRKLTVTEPDAETLELCFATAQGEGAPRIKQPLKRRQRQPLRLQRLTITPCNATDLKGALMRMLTRLHLELEFTDFCQGEENQAVASKPAGVVHIPAA